MNNTFYCAGKEYTTYDHPVAAPLFKRVITRQGEGAFIEIAALGFYELYVNGKIITKGLIAPYISNPYHLNYFDRYELDEYLHDGENVIAVLLGNGLRNDHGGQIWDFDKAPFRGAPALAIELFDGKDTYTAEDFVWKRSAILYDDYRCGVIFDARLWDTDDLTGTSVDGYSIPVLIDDEPIGDVLPCKAEPISVYEERRPCAIYGDSNVLYKPRGGVYKGECFMNADDFTGGYLYDFGKNTAGTARLHIKGEPGQRVTLRFGELREGNDLDLNTVNFQPDPFVQMCVFICDGREFDFTIPFTFYGYRYCHVHGITEDQATEELLTMLVASSAFSHRTTFECSDSTVNALWKIARNSDLSNFYYFPMDCPQREKNGWTGDASESIEHMMLLYAPEKSLAQWYDSILAAQDERGAFPGIVPTGGWGFKWGNGPSWDRIVTNLPYYVYKYTGNIEPANKAFPYILKYLKYLASRRSECGTLNIGLGDYCQFGRPADKPTTPIEFTDTVVAYDICQKALELAYSSAVGTIHPTPELLCVREELLKYATAFSDELRTAARERFLDKSDMSLAGGTQTAQAFGLEYGIFDECEKKAATERLVKEIEKDGGHMNFGFLGSRVTFHALSNGGYESLAYKMITQESEPSYGSIVKRGFTSLPERFETPTDKYPHASFNHHFFGDITHWFIKNILGLSVNPECRDASSVVISPCVLDEIEYASGERQMPDGNIRIDWKRDGERIILNVKYSGGVTISFNERDEFTSSVLDMKENEITIEYRKA